MEGPEYSFLLFTIQNTPVGVILAQVCSDEISVHIFNSLIPCLIPYLSQKGTTPNIPGSFVAFSKPCGQGIAQGQGLCFKS